MKVVNENEAKMSIFKCDSDQTKARDLESVIALTISKLGLV
jgi:hypothetical protein